MRTPLLETSRPAQPEDVADALLAGVTPVVGEEEVGLTSSIGRVLCRPLIATLPLPVFDNAAVDGYAISRGAVASKAQRLPIAGRQVAGSSTSIGAAEGALRIFTGAPVPTGFAAVVPQECCKVENGWVVLARPAKLDSNLRRRGEDIEPGEVVIAADTLIDARHAGVAAALGCRTLTVRRRARAAVLSNGDELRQPGEALAPGQIYDANRPMILAMLAALGAETTDLGCEPDAPDLIAGRLAAADVDLIVVCGGVSVGEEDHVRPAIEAAGGWLRPVGLAIKPGKPAAYGRLGSTHVLGLPGNPFAALVAFLLLGRPLAVRLSGTRSQSPLGVEAVAAFDLERRPGRTEFAPARLVGHDVEGRPAVQRLGKGGSARFLPLIMADGLVRIAPEATHVSPGDRVRFYSLTDLFGW